MEGQLDRLQHLPPERRELVLRKVRERKAREARKRAAPPLLPVPRAGDLPLSFAQQRLWFLHQFEEDSSPYTMRVALRLRGRLDREALQRSLNALVQRHEILRTTFPAVQGMPVQRIAPTGEMPLTHLDLTGLEEAAREEKVQRLAAEEAERPFDLARGPLYRANLLAFGPREHVLLLAMHHIMADSWSLGILVRELSQVYTALVEGREASPLPPLAVHYADFAVWQRNWLSGEVLERQLAYWKKKLAGAPSLLGLPTDRPRPPVQSYNGAAHPITVPPEITARLKSFSTEAGASLFMTLLAAYKLLLYRYTGQSDLLVGMPIAGRNHREVESLIGFFANTLVLRTEVRGEESFRELLARVRQGALEGYAHQDLAFEKLVEEIHPQRSLSHTPLFQTMFVLQNAPSADLSLPSLVVERLELPSRSAKFDLELNMVEEGEGLGGIFEYNTDLFDGASIARMARHFNTLLEEITAAPGRPVAALPLLREEERRDLIAGRNATRAHYPKEEGFHRLFEAQVERTPDAVAVTDADGQLTYRALNRRANRLAHHLRAMGVGPESTVALLAERGDDLLTAILAVFKAGGAYLPLEPRYPIERYRQVLEQSGTPLVLAANLFLPELEEATAGMEAGRRPQLHSLERLLQRRGPSGNLSVEGAPRNLAYIIYTSGSTGLPKGAMVERRGMINHLYAKIRDLALTERDVVAQNASQCFDISVWQFLAALLVGGQVSIYRDEVAYDPVRLLSRVVEDGVTILEVVPSLMQAMLDAVTSAEGRGRPDLSALRWLIPTGEALPPRLARQWKEQYPRLPLLNAYGPTECSDDVTHYVISEPPGETVANMPIGRPIINTQIYLLDPRLEPVPERVAGEIYVGGDGVGRGYLNDPRRTALAFYPDPFPAGGEGARLYRTGDLGRYDPRGEIEFLGRVDHQVKVRGFRIELGEIESVLRRHPAVAETVVLAREDTPGDRRLVAYLVPTVPLSTTELRAFLAERLPDYMIPAAFVPLEALPLTPNGKVDRKGLPAPERDQMALARRYVAPRNDLERLLATIWEEALGLERVGIHDNFFEIGGHSLLGVQIGGQLQAALEMEIPLRNLFTRPTIAELAENIEALRRTREMLARASDLPAEEEEAFIL